MLLGLACALGAALLYGVASVAQAVAARRLPPSSAGWLRLLGAAARSPVLIAVVCADLIGAGLHLVAIDTVPLYLAQAGIAASLPVTAVVSARVLRERLSGGDWVAVAATAIGIGLLAGASGEAGGSNRGPGMVVGLYAAFVALLLLGALAYAASGRFSGAALSLLSGLGYSATTLGARVLGAPDWSWRTVALCLVMALSGLLGFFLYSFAMQRIPVAGATAPLVVSETVVPTIVGVTLLGDAVSKGGWPLVVVGLVIALTGSLRLAGYEARAQDRVAQPSSQAS